jgi:hypothetical protein
LSSRTERANFAKGFPVANNTSPLPLDDVASADRALVAAHLIYLGGVRLCYDLGKYGPEIVPGETLKTTEKMREFERRMHQLVEGFCRATEWPRQAIKEGGSPELAAWSDCIHALVGGMWEKVQRAFRPTLPTNERPDHPLRYCTLVGDTTDVPTEDWEEMIEAAYAAAERIATTAAADLRLALVQLPTINLTGA